MLVQYNINEKFLTDVTVRIEHNPYAGRTDLTDQDLIEAIKYNNTSFSISHEDHDEFTVLRNQLEQQGYIRCQRQWVNGDRVLKSFKLNEWTFKKGQNFPCAAALGCSMRTARKFGWKKLI
jgi:hypothetical protein